MWAVSNSFTGFASGATTLVVFINESWVATDLPDTTEARSVASLCRFDEYAAWAKPMLALVADASRNSAFAARVAASARSRSSLVAAALLDA